MAWKIEFVPGAEKDLNKIDPKITKRILLFLNNRVAKLRNPQSIGESLKGSALKEFWKYRVGDYRIIANINNEAICILVVRIGHRKDVYKDKS